MKTLIILLALVPSLANAADTWGSLNLTSLHSRTENAMNQRNYGLGIEYHASSDVLYLAGAYRNSYEKTSVYALAGWAPVEVGIARIGVLGGLVNGYPKRNNAGVTPAVAGIVLIEGERVGMNLILIPPPLKKSPFTLGLQVKFKF